MKTLLFFRHGKSDWDADFSHDHERPLAQRGVKAAKRMGVFLRVAGLIPDRIICSTAVRARTTLKLAQEAGTWPSTMRLTETLYHAGPHTLLQEIHAEPNETDILMLIGHEPTWSETIEQMIGGGMVRFPTAAIACVSIDVDTWGAVRFGAGTLQWLVTPRLLKTVINANQE